MASLFKAGVRGNSTSLTAASSKAALVKVSVCFFLLVSLSLAWRLTPLSHIDFETIVRWQESIKHYPGAFVWVLAVYVTSSLVLFPVTLLNLATVATFGPITGNLYAFAGWLSSAAIAFGIGRIMGHDWIQKMARPGMDSFLQRTGRHGFLTVLSTRMVPIAPFTVVNLFVGASEIGFGVFLLATAVGRIPGIVTLSLFGVQLQMFLHRQNLASWIILAVTVLLIALATAWSCKRFAACGDRGASIPEGKNPPPSLG